MLPRGLAIPGRDLLRFYNTYDDWLWRFCPAAPVTQSRCRRIHVARGHVYCIEHHVLHCRTSHRVQCPAVNQERHGRQVTGRIPNDQGHWRGVRPKSLSSEQGRGNPGFVKASGDIQTLLQLHVKTDSVSVSNIPYLKTVKQFQWQ